MATAMGREFALFEINPAERKILQNIIKEIAVLKDKTPEKQDEACPTTSFQEITQAESAPPQKPKKSLFSRIFPSCTSGRDSVQFSQLPYPEAAPQQLKAKLLIPTPSASTSSLYPSVPNLLTLKEQFSHTLHELRQQHSTLRDETVVGTFDAFQLPCNRCKLRALDIICFDSTRVKLDPPKDFIHANYVSDHKKVKAYICCQSPFSETVDDFWDMVWQQNCRLIVSPTSFSQWTDEQCTSYWPQGQGNVKSQGRYDIKNISEERELSTLSAVLHVTNRQTTERRELYHLMFLGWPNDEVPKTAVGFLAFMLRANYYHLNTSKLPSMEFYNQGQKPPMVVHCKNGVEVSSVFIALDVCMHLVDSLQQVNVEEVVRKIRSERAQAVYRPELYLFLYMTLLEYVKLRSYHPSVTAA